MKNRKQTLITGIVIGIFFVFTVLFYGPLSQYLSNAEELWFSLKDVLQIIVPFSLGVLLVIFIFFLVIPLGAGSFFLNLLFGVSLALYIQGNYIKSSYGTGVMDGTEIDWSAYRAYGVANLILWIVCILLPFVLTVVLKKKKIQITKVLIIASLFLTVIQVPAMVVQALSWHPNKNADLKITTNGMFELASEENVIFIILDTLDDAYYNQFLETHQEFTDQLTGFIHYDNMLASGSRTTVGVPSMLTGSPYKKQSTYSDYIKEIYTQDNPLSQLDEAGYDVGVYSETVLFPTEASDYVSNFSAGGGEVSSRKILAKKIYKLDLFRFVPHFLKKYVWFDTAEFEEARGTADDYKLNDAGFYQKYLEEGFTVSESEEKAFRLYHLYGAHEPYNLNSDGQRVSESTCEEQVAGCFKMVQDMLNGLKETGLYDQATIIVTADHGDKDKAQHSMLLLKEAGSQNNYTTTHVPASAFDLTIFLAELAGKELPEQPYGMKLDSLTEGMERERHMFHNTTNDNKFIIDEYKTVSDADDYNSLEYVQTYEDLEDENTPYELGTELSFTTDATGNKYCLEGIGSNTGFRSRLCGPQALFSIPIADLPEKGNLTVHFDLHKKSVKGTSVVAAANGTEVFRGEIDENAISDGLDLTVPVDTFDKTGILKIEFRFPEIAEEEMELDTRKRTETISLVSMLITAE